VADSERYQLVKESLNNAIENGYDELLTMDVDDVVDDLLRFASEVETFEAIEVTGYVTRWKDEQRRG
jgi:hypothetical protein